MRGAFAFAYTDGPVEGKINKLKSISEAYMVMAALNFYANGSYKLLIGRIPTPSLL